MAFCSVSKDIEKLFVFCSFLILLPSDLGVFRDTDLVWFEQGRFSASTPRGSARIGLGGIHDNNDHGTVTHFGRNVFSRAV